MSQLNVFITGYLAGISGYYMRQVAVICVLFIFGAILTDAVTTAGMPAIRRCVLAFPVGLSAFIITAYAILVAAIPYNVTSVCLAVGCEAAVAVIVRRHAFTGSVPGRCKHMAIALTVVVAVALFACSALTPVAISNDTMYYFKRYPECIVYYEGLRDQFDCWLTDTGLGSVVIDTLPPMFGFGESFGIREFFHIDFMVFFYICIWDRAKKYFWGRDAIVVAAIATLFLAVATPFLILGHWALANMYFMELFFIAAYTVLDRDDMIIVGSILIVALSLLRIEGTVFAVWHLLCLALYSGRRRRLAVYTLLPTIVLFGGYCIRIFTQFYLYDNIYLFLKPAKAVVLVSALIGTAVYISFIQSKLPQSLQKRLPVIYIVGLVAANLILLVRNSELYIGDLKVFIANLFGQSGWGMLPYFVISMTAVLAVEFFVSRGKRKTAADDFDSFNIVLTVGFLLVAVIASFGRGDVMQQYIGDSGNRVMLQIVPLVVMTYSSLFMGQFAEN